LLALNTSGYLKYLLIGDLITGFALGCIQSGQPNPPFKKGFDMALIRPYEGKPMVNKALFLEGGTLEGG